MIEVSLRAAREYVRLLIVLLCVVLVSSASSEARADEVKALRYDLRVDIPVTSVALAAWLTSELLKDQLAPKNCRWCESQSFDANARESLRWSNTEPAYKLSNWMGFGVVPLATAAGISALALSAGTNDGAQESPQERLAIDLLVIAEATFLSSALNQLVKYTFGRERPFVYVLAQDDKARTKHPSDNNLSFYSAHASTSFSLVTAAGTVASMRGYESAGGIWGVGLPLAAFTGYLRVAADRHYLSDVLMGAVMGSAVGVLVPFLLHSPQESKGTSMSVGASRNTLTLTWVH